MITHPRRSFGILERLDLGPRHRFDVEHVRVAKVLFRIAASHDTKECLLDQTCRVASADPGACALREQAAFANFLKTLIFTKPSICIQVQNVDLLIELPPQPLPTIASKDIDAPANERCGVISPWGRRFAFWLQTLPESVFVFNLEQVGVIVPCRLSNATPHQHLLVADASARVPPTWRRDIAAVVDCHLVPYGVVWIVEIHVMDIIDQ